MLRNDEQVTPAQPAAASPASGTGDAAGVFRPASVRIEKTFRLPYIAFCMASDHQPTRVFCGGSDFSIHQFNPTAEKIEPTALSDSKHESYVTGLVRVGATVVSCSYDGSLMWWNVETGEVIRRVADAHNKWVRMLAVSADNTRIASVADDMQTRLWNAESGECLAIWGDYDLKTPHGYPSMLYAVAFSDDGQWLATGNRTGRVLVREVASGRIAATIETPIMYTWDPKARRHSIGGIRSLAFSHDGTLLSVGGIGTIGNIDHLGGHSRIETFRWQTGERLYEISDSKYQGLVEAMQYSSDDQWLLAAGGDNGGFMSAFSASDGKLLTQEKAPMHVHDFEMHNDNTVIAVGHEQGIVVKLSAEPAPA